MAIATFLELATWIFEFLVLALLPLVSVIIAAIMIRKIGESGRDTLYRFFAEGWASYRSLFDRRKGEAS